MPRIEVIFYCEKRSAPALDWLLDQQEKVQDKFAVAIEQLSANGTMLRRPLAGAPLRSKIYELRVRWKQVNYRLLYFFHGNVAAVAAHGCTKEAAVDDADIDRAVRRREAFLNDPGSHTHKE